MATRTETVLVFLPQGGESVLRILGGVQDVARSRPWTFSAVECRNTGNGKLRMFRSPGGGTVEEMLDKINPDGVIVVHNVVEAPALRRPGRRTFPVVYIDRPVGTTAPRRAPHVCVFGEDASFARLAATELFRSGFHDFVFLPWPDDPPWSRILPHWNWPERVGLVTPVYVYSSGDEVELFLNGVSQGRKRREKGLWRFLWPNVVYAPGELKAVAYRGGAKWCEETIRTTGEAARLVLEEEGGGFLTCRVVDANGDTVPRACVPVRVEVSGCGEFVAADNGDETDMAWYRSPIRKTFNGLLSIIVRAIPDASGTIRVTVSSEGLLPCGITLRS